MLSKGRVVKNPWPRSPVFHLGIDRIDNDDDDDNINDDDDDDGLN